jgi:hypothetical protein
MRRVVSSLEETVNVSEIKNSSVVGITIASQLGYGVVKDTHPGGQVCFRLIGVSLDITGTCPYDSKRELCKDVLSLGGKVFLFDNDVELFNWMVKKYG